MSKKKYIYSILASLLGQLISIICGIVLPRILIKYYGSELNGASASISRFLGYIALLEGGIGGVARAALYKPIAENDEEQISKVISYVQYFFRKVAFVFCIYSLIIACSYKYIARDISLDWTYTFFLVIVIALSSLAQYYFGIAYTVFLQADQKSYITRLLEAGTLLLNTIVSYIFVYYGAGMLLLKLAWCGVHLIRIGILNTYINSHYHLKKTKFDNNYLSQAWDGLGQHIAFFLHSNADEVILTIFVNLKEVSVYSIYNYIAIGLNTMISSSIANLEAVFGDMLARKEEINNFFDYIEFILHSVIVVGFSIACVLILPFVKIYTKGIRDANYFRPILAYLMLMTQCISCIRAPYHNLIIAAGHFKRTRNVAFIEAGLNIGGSCVLAVLCGTEGIIVATLIAILYRTIYYVAYLKNNIIYRNPKRFVKRICITCLNLLINISIFIFLSELIGEIDTFIKWVMSAIVYLVLGIILMVICAEIFYRRELFKFIKQMREIFHVREKSG